MKKLLVLLGLFLITNISYGYVIYYPPAYYNPYMTHPYYHHNFYNTVSYPTDVNSCPLQGSYYDVNGNWVAPQRVCPSTTPQVNINVNR